MSFQESDNLWWDAFTTEFFEDDAILTLAFCLEDGPKRYSKSLCCFLTMEKVQLLPSSGVVGMAFKSLFHFDLSSTSSLNSMFSISLYTSVFTWFSVFLSVSLLREGKIIGKSFQNSPALELIFLNLLYIHVCVMCIFGFSVIKSCYSL